jgi:hypothetical protein
MTAVPATEPAAGPAPPDLRFRLRHLPWSLALSALVAAASAAVGGALAGGVGAVGAAVGVAVVALASALSTLAVAWADGVATALVLPAGIMAYIMKLTLVGAAMFAAAAAGWAGLVPMAWGVVAGVAGWTAALIWRQTRGV